LEQTLTTVAGQSDDISYWRENCPDLTACTPNALTVRFGSTILQSQTNVTPSLWTLFTFDNVVAPTNSTVLKFSGDNGPSGFLLDDISVNASTPVPEPVSLPLVASFLIGFIAIARSRHPQKFHESL
jgi:hypothetical protein